MWNKSTIWEGSSEVCRGTGRGMWACQNHTHFSIRMLIFIDIQPKRAIRAEELNVRYQTRVSSEIKIQFRRGVWGKHTIWEGAVRYIAKQWGTIQPPQETPSENTDLERSIIKFYFLAIVQANFARLIVNMFSLRDKTAVVLAVRGMPWAKYGKL